MSIIVGGTVACWPNAIRHRGHGSRRALRPADRRRRSDLQLRGRRGARPPRAQRRRQDHDGGDPRGVPAAHGGPGAGARPRSHCRPAGAGSEHRGHAAAWRRLPGDERARSAPAVRRLLRGCGGPRHPRGADGAPRRGTDTVATPVGRRAAAAVARPGSRGPAQGGVPRRADGRRGPRRPPGHPPSRQRAPGPGRRRAPHDPRDGGSRAVGRPSRDHRQRCRRRHGQPGGADDGGSGTRDPFRRSARVGGRRPRRLARRPRHRGPTRRVPRRHGSDAGGRGRPHRLAGRPRPAPGRPAGRPATPRGRLPAAHGRLPGTAGSVRGYVAQTRAEVTMTLRRGDAVLLTLGIPVLLLAFFSLVHVLPTTSEEPIDFLAPGILALAVMSTAMVSLGIATAFERSYGVLKRLGTTPLGRPSLLAAKITAIGLVEVVQVAVLVPVALGLGWDPHGDVVPGMVAFFAATVAFAGIGLLMAGTLRAEVTLAAATGLYLVLLLLGGMIVPLSKLPGGLADAARLLPAAALSDSLFHALGSGGGIPLEAWLVLLVWAVAAPVAAALTFRWE